MFSTDEIVVFRGERFFGGDRIGVNPEFDTFILSLFTTEPPEPRGSLFISLPISGIKWRRSRMSSGRAKWYRSGNDLRLWDDHGTEWRIISSTGVVDMLVDELNAWELPELKHGRDELKPAKAITTATKEGDD